MIFEELDLPGAFRIRLERSGDDRGFFARAWCRNEFEAHGLQTDLAQANVSLSRRKGTLRGLHLQTPPNAEAKLVRCTRGAIYDVMVDLRLGSPTRGEWLGLELPADDYTMVYVPEGCAHGFQTLADDTEVFYLVTGFYSSKDERGVRFNDPSFGIVWPETVTEISDRDRAWPNYVLSPGPAETPTPGADLA